MASTASNSKAPLTASASSTLLWSGSTTDKTAMSRYLSLPQPEGKVTVEYVWVWADGTGLGVRSKCRTMDHVPKSPEECPVWTFNGSNAGNLDGTSTDMYLHPVALFSDPFRRGNNMLCLCGVYDSSNQPARTNHRNTCLSVIQKARDSMPIFGMEQEFTLMDCSRRPFGWHIIGYPSPEGPYYCGVGADRVYGRDILEAYYRACQYAGILISGYKADVMPGQWAYQLGPCEGSAISDQLWMSRFLLKRVAEDFGLAISFEPKPVSGKWHMSSINCTFSTKTMREDGGLNFIQEAIHKLEKAHKNDVKWYSNFEGVDNAKRLLDHQQSLVVSKPSAGITDRCTSIRIPHLVVVEKKGYLEDKRPLSNFDPYLIVERLVRTVVFGEM